MKPIALASLLLASVAGVHATPDAASQNESIALLAASTCLAPEYHFDYPGNDVGNALASSFDQCCDVCTFNKRCNAYTWTNYNGGTCWLKSLRSRSEWKGANADGSANTVSVEINRCSKALTPDHDLTGTELGSSEGGQRPESCCVRCSFLAYEGCKGFSWTDYNGGTCWFKAPPLQMVYKPGVLAFSCL